MNIVVGEYIGKTIRPVRDEDHVGEPIVGFVIKDPEGWFAITNRDEVEKHDSFHGAVHYVGRRWRDK